MDKDYEEFRTPADKFWDTLIFGGCFVILLFIAGTFVMISRHDYIMAAVFGAITVLWIALNRYAVYRDDKRIIERKQQYKDTYVSVVTAHDSSFGELSFEYDSKKKELHLDSAQLVKFGGEGIEVNVDDYDGNINTVMSYIRRAYDDKDTILEGLYDLIEKNYKEEGYSDFEGDVIDRAYIADKFIFTELNIFLDPQERYICLQGEMLTEFYDLVRDRGVAAEFKTDGTYEYILA